MLQIHFDGLCEPKNPGGIATYGFLVRRGKKILHEGHGLAATPWSDQATSNVAEYTGVLRALEWVVEQELQGEKTVVNGDSQLVIRQIEGEYAVKSPLLVPLYTKVKDQAGRFTDLKFKWVDRDRNKDADRLSRVACAEYRSESLGAPTTDTMTVNLIFGAPRDQVAEALRKSKVKATVTPVPGGTRVQCDLPTNADALMPILEIKERLEGRS